MNDDRTSLTDSQYANKFLIEYFALALHFGSGFINSNSQKRDLQKGTVMEYTRFLVK